MQERKVPVNMLTFIGNSFSGWRKEMVSLVRERRCSPFHVGTHGTLVAWSLGPDEV